MTFRQDYYRSLCFHPREYDDVIDLIIDMNPYVQGQVESGRYSCAEEFACNAVHSCINSVLWGESEPHHSSTGGAIAVRVSTKPSMPGYKQVFLAYCGGYPEDIQETVRAIANGTTEVVIKKPKSKLDELVELSEALGGYQELKDTDK